MKEILKIAILICLSAFTFSCQSFSNKDGIKFSALPWPDMIGIPPDKSVKNWIKLDLIGTMNHPFPFFWFSPQEFKREYPNVLIKLEEYEYEKFRIFVRANACTTKLEEVSGEPILRVTEYADEHEEVRCIMPSAKACEYVTKMYAIPQISWTDEQVKELQLMANDLDCDLK